VQTVAIRDRGDEAFHRQHLKGAGHEVTQEQEEGLHEHEHADDVRHHVAVLAAVGEDHDGGVSGEQPTPEKQRTFLSAPPSGELIKQWHAAVTMLGNIGETEVARDETVDQDAGADRDERPNGVDRALAANYQKGLAPETADNGCEEGVDSGAKSQKYS